MTKSEYAKLLLDSRWDEVRKRILKRDNYRCKKCKCGNQRLSVHHTVYLKGGMPWDVPDRFLQSLCDRCHEAAHATKTINSFTITSLPKGKRSKNNPTTLKKNKERRGRQSTPMVWVAGKGLVER